MRAQLSRRGFFGVAGTAGLLAAGVGAVEACSSDRPANDQSDGTVTISHLFGETTLSAPPKRVVSAGYTGQDDLLAVGVVPIAVTSWFGDQPYAVWPWARSQLGAAQPAVLNLDNGIAVDQIAGLKPDLIVATNAGVDAETYQKLSAIAPTLPQSGGDAFFEPWKDQATAIGKAVFASDKMTSLLDAVDEKLTGVADAHPGFKGKKALLLDGRLQQGKVVSATGWRTAFLTQLGLTIPGGSATIAADQIKGTLGGADVLIWTTDNDDEKAALLTNPDIAAVAARSVFTTTELAGAIAFASPLSYPVVADQLPPLIAKITG